jgi:hypothetical protein
LQAAEIVTGRNRAQLTYAQEAGLKLVRKRLWPKEDGGGSARSSQTKVKFDVLAQDNENSMRGMSPHCPIDSCRENCNKFSCVRTGVADCQHSHPQI